ncbi:MAG: transposase [Enterocloster sp.]
MITARFIKKTSITADGECAQIKFTKLIRTPYRKKPNMTASMPIYTKISTDDPSEIAAVNQGRWEIEESFRIMKSKFETRRFT